MRYDAIPQELKEQKAWVNVWNGSKVPMQSTMRKAASSSNPDTWSTFDDAVQAVNDGIYDGIGYVFHDNGYVGIDIDDGFADGVLNDLSIDVMKLCCSYTEKSRSGRGVHVLVKGELPFKGKNNREAVEIYKSNRYFIMTGKVIIFKNIVENQNAIDSVVQKYFPERVKENTNVGAERIYSPTFEAPADGKIFLKPRYPPIKAGSRNLSLASLAGQMHGFGASKRDIYRELLIANQIACVPPLRQAEIEQIVNSITRYRR